MVKNHAMPATAFQPPSPRSPVLLRARQPRLPYPGLAHFADLSFDITPGLALVRGGDGRGKTSLLRLMAGEITATAGRIERLAGPAFRVDSREAGADDQTIAQWTAHLMPAYPDWDAAQHRELCTALGLEEHEGKTFHMLSTGTRRKAAIAAAFASGAPLTLLDTPFAALDAPSREVVGELLNESARHESRAFVLADHLLPPGLRDAPLAGVIELGD